MMMYDVEMLLIRVMMTAVTASILVICSSRTGEMRSSCRQRARMRWSKIDKALGRLWGVGS